MCVCVCVCAQLLMCSDEYELGAPVHPVIEVHAMLHSVLDRGREEATIVCCPPKQAVRGSGVQIDASLRTFRVVAAADLH